MITQYRDKIVQVPQIIKCDKCGYEVDKTVSWQKDLEADEFLSIEIRGGYQSKYWTDGAWFQITDDVPYEKEKREMEQAHHAMIVNLQSTPKKILGKIVMLEKTKRTPHKGELYLDYDDLYDKTTYKRRPEITGNDIIKVAVSENLFAKEYYCFSTVEDLVEKQNKQVEKPVDKEVLDAMLPPIDKIEKANNTQKPYHMQREELQDIKRYCPESFYRTISDDKFLEVINRGWIPNGWAVFDKNKHEAFMDQYGQVHTTGHGNKGYALILTRDKSKFVRSDSIELDHKINKLNTSFQELNKTLQSLGNELMEINEEKINKGEVK